MAISNQSVWRYPPHDACRQPKPLRSNFFYYPNGKPQLRAGYWATQGEVPLHVVQMRMQAPKVWCLPLIQHDKTLNFAPWRSGDDLVSNQYGIPEPDISPTSALDAVDISIVLIPLLAYTRKGSRLGMGGGFYDRSFAFRHANRTPPLLVGVAYSDQEAENTVAGLGCKLDMLINEREVLRF